ncbi:MAG: hypothetical protein R3F56_17235 [Planctomycetota bacterium]
MGIEPRLDQGGVVLATGDPATVYRCNLELGLAVRVLLRLGRFHCRSLGELVRKSARLPWNDWLLPGRYSVRAESRLSRLYHRDAIAERVVQAAASTLGGGPSAEPDAPSVLVRFLHDECTISLDTTGRPLHDRGYRREPGPAPLREDLSRALLLASGWDPTSTLIDPFAGAGTLLIEAALLARRLAPGRNRTFAVADTRLFDPEVFARVQAAAERRALPRAPRLLGSDRRADCIDMARRNAALAGVEGDLDLAVAPLSSSPWRDELAGAGAVVTDPPHGRRMGDPARLALLYRSLGTWLAAAAPTCRIAIASSDRRLALRTGLPLKTAFLSTHGGAKLRALVAAPDDDAGSAT